MPTASGLKEGLAVRFPRLVPQSYLGVDHLDDRVEPSESDATPSQLPDSLVLEAGLLVLVPVFLDTKNVVGD